MHVMLFQPLEHIQKEFWPALGISCYLLFSKRFVTHLLNNNNQRINNTTHTDNFYSMYF
uniref:Uncharacterized protein n=1 Tax=Anguilla anguilla TaxID=7936 RepID=A0A0E9WHR8_ANGAN